ncbi:MAG: glycosyltransferase family 2 protein [Alphaproteobacteria bacterium]|nr:glycosyltransferase family 2 protein [Alphaproteobacteria bacterium]MCW5743714.1 glycosyltransferase family 2 protein [Alphaproteobacteria bacterium]
MPTLSVLICTRNRPAKVLRAVESVLRNTFTDFELIVVDQTDDESTRVALAMIRDSRLRYIGTRTVGVAISRNIAIRAARADIVVFTDDDCVCDAGWLAAIHAEFRMDRAALGVYGRVIPFGSAGRNDWDCLSQAGDLICPAVNQSTTRLVVQSPAIPHLTLGAGNNMSFRKEAFHRVGLFMESLGPGSRIGTGEDLEFTYRLLWHRCRLVYSPDPLVEHDNWLDAGAFAHMMKVAIRVQAAVLGAYALRFDTVAIGYLMRLAWWLACNRLATGSAVAGLAWFAWGLMSAPLYRVARPPRAHHSKEEEVLRLAL